MKRENVFTIYGSGYIEGGTIMDGPEPLYPAGVEIEGDDPTVYEDDGPEPLYSPELQKFFDEQEQGKQESRQRAREKFLPNNDLEGLFPPGVE